MKPTLQLVLATLAFGLIWTPSHAEHRLDTIRHRGVLTCGVSPGVAGFSEVDSRERHTGLDVDMCRAMSAAIFGAPDKVKYIDASDVQKFIHSDEIDVVSRRLTWELKREGSLDLLFGPITFFDGQGFLVPKRRGATRVAQLAGATVCVEPRTSSQINLVTYFRENKLDLKKVTIEPMEEADRAFEAGQCDAYTADVSELGAMRSKMRRPGDFDILAEQISKEPLAQLVRQGDDQFFDILRWTISALIAAEELGITSKNVDEMLKSDDPAVRRFLGVNPGNGKALGLDERWAYNIVKTLGNYGEIFDRNVGGESPIKLERGLNRLWTNGGLMYAPPLR